MADRVKRLEPFSSLEAVGERMNTSIPETYNRKYKDTLFTSLFGNKEYAKLLYESLFPDRESVCEDDINLISLENIFTVERYNDTCMLVKDALIVLTEHQSTINQNMPMRLLLYVAEEYKRIFSGEKSRDLFKSRMVMVPAPEIFVVYTGKGNHPDYLYLSDAYRMPASSLELTVSVVDWTNAVGILKEYIQLSQDVDSGIRGLHGQDRVRKIDEVVQKMKNEGLNDEHFNRIKKKIYGDYVVEYNSVGDIARMFLSDKIKQINSFDYIEEYNEVTKEYTEQILKNVFKEENMILSVVKCK